VPETSIEACTALLKSGSLRSSQAASAYLSLAQAFIRSGKFDNAIVNLTEGLKYDPFGMALFHTRAMAYEAKGDLKEAIEDFTRATRVAPDPRSFVARGRIYGLQKHYDLAISDYDQALRLDPDHPAALNNRCWTRAVWGRNLPAARHDCDRSLELQPGDAATLSSRAVVRFKLGDFSGAIADSDASIESDASIAEAHFVRGAARLRLAQSEGTIDIAEAERIQPGITEEYSGYDVRWE
jgi:tetratricopeptide (TPR) repeat protein